MKKPFLYGCLSLLAFVRPVLAEPPPAPPAMEVQGGEEGRFGQEEHRRLRGDLDDYSRQAYPDREQLEERRRMMRERMLERLRQADKNEDGSISRAEAGRHMPGLARHFDRIDSNGDGVLTREEMKAARERRREMRERLRGEGASGQPYPRR